MVNLENYEEYMLLYADKELSPEQEQALLDFVVRHPGLKAELDAYTATRLQPDQAVVFAGKDSLMKTGPGGRTMWLGGWKTYAAAAGVILFVVLFTMNRNSKEVVTPTIAKKGTITAPVITMPTENTSLAGQSQSQASNTLEEKAPESVSPLGGKGEELHSNSTVNAVAVKTTKPTTPKEPVAREVQAQENEMPAPLNPTPEKEEVIVQSVVEDTAEYMADAATPQEKTITEPQDVKVIASKSTDKKNGLITAVLGEKPVVLARLEEEVNEKITAAKTIREQIKNTDAEVSFRIGKKELFTVRL